MVREIALVLVLQHSLEKRSTIFVYKSESIKHLIHLVQLVHLVHLALLVHFVQWVHSVHAIPFVHKFSWFRLPGSLPVHFVYLVHLAWFNGLVNLVTLPASPVSLRFLGLLGPTAHLVSLGPASLVSSRMRIDRMGMINYWNIKQGKRKRSFQKWNEN